ncbi:unnamed protein product [Brassica napus]|uniref:(rape) hypothetical protein n=1 Tax=Brassica napus TaxID=3708 RepID=A0A816VGN8_BRANA|nr:unnamed protein product [Brassica napus]
MAKTLSRSTASRIANRFFSTSKALAPSQSNLISRPSSPTLFHAVGFIPSSTTLDDILQTQKIQSRVVHRSSERHSPRRSRSKFSYRPPTTEISPLPSGCDYKHWLIVIDKPAGRIPGVIYVLPNSYVDPEYKDYGGELFLNGEVVPRPPERQRRIVRFMTPILRYNDRTRNVRGRESML